MDENQLWSIKFSPYTDCKFPVSNLNSTVVWPRLCSSSEKDVSALFVGYSNLETEYGDEGIDIFYDTPKCSRTVFFSGDDLDYRPKESNQNSDQNTYNDMLDDDNAESWVPKDRIDQNKYNHLYGDFRYLHKDFSYLIDSEFFEYVFVGNRTFIYFPHINVISEFLSMVKRGGSLIIGLNENTLAHYCGPFLDKYYEKNMEFIPYFYSVPSENDQLLANILYNNRSIFSDFRNNSVNELSLEISENIPFAHNFFEQNDTDESPIHDNKESCILRIIKY